MKNLNIILVSLILASCSGGGPSSSDVDMLATGEINEIICEEECVIEGVSLKDAVLESVNLSNITFQNSYFENVTIKGSRAEPTILDKVKFIDSDIKDLKIKDFVFTYNPLTVQGNEYIRFNIYVDACLSIENPTRRDECWDDNVSGILDEYGWPGLVDCDRAKFNCSSMAEEVMTLHFKNVTGNIKIDDQSEFIGIKIIDSDFNNLEIDNIAGKGHISLYSDNSTFENFSFLNNKRWAPVFGFPGALSGAPPFLSLKNTKIDYLNGLILGYTIGGKGEDRPIEENAFICENSEFGNGNLLMVIDYCDDMGINFDEFAVRDFEKTFFPDNSMVLLKDFINSDYSSPYVGKSIEGFNKQADNIHNQLYAISSGDDEFLMSYLDGIYKHLFLKEVWVYETRICGNQHSLLDFNWNGTYGYRDDCQTERVRMNQIQQWLELPDSFKTKIDKRTSNFLSGLKSSTDIKEDFISEFVKKNHDFSNLKNCLRTKDIKSIRETLSKLYAVPDRGSRSGKVSRRGMAMQTYMQKKASEINEIQSFRSCIEQNISISIPQIQAAYSPISKLTTYASKELRDYEDEEKRLLAVAAQKRREEREKLFATFVENNQDVCGPMATSAGSQIINMFYSGSAESKKARTNRAWNSCNRCYFNFWSNMLSDGEFLKFANGDTENMTTDMSTFGVADFKKMTMCPVAGADPQVQKVYASKLDRTF